MNALYLAHRAGEQSVKAIHAKTVGELMEYVLASHTHGARSIARVAGRGSTRDQSSRNLSRVRRISRLFLTHESLFPD